MPSGREDPSRGRRQRTRTNSALPLLLLAAVFSTTSVRAVADGRFAVAGMVDDVDPRGAVDVRRKTTPRPDLREQAHYHTLLYPGDRLEFHVAGKLEADLCGKSRTYHAGDVDMTVPDCGAGDFGEKGEALLGVFWPFTSSSRRAAATYTWSRSGQGGPRPPALTDPLAPSGHQLVPAGQTHLVVLWRNGPGLVTVEAQGNRSVNVDSFRNAWVDVPLAPGAAYYQISVDQPGLQWSVETAPTAPVPPWFDGAQPATVAQRLVRAVWLLKEGPQDWRLFALAELEDLAAAGDFQARQFWDGARSGELQEELAK
jgi:hypothetical protein